MSVGAPKRILWKDTPLGDYGYISFDYSGNNDVRIIPKAKGVKIRSTSELGGGVLTINVTALVAKDNRLELETFFYNLDSNFSLTEKGDLKVSDSNGTLTLTDCYLDSFSQGTDDLKVTTFNFKFTKSL